MQQEGEERAAGCGRNMRGLLQLRGMLKREMLAEGACSEERLRQRLQEEWSTLTPAQRAELSRMSRNSYQFHTPNEPSPSNSSSSAKVERSNAVRDQIKDPLIPYIVNEAIFRKNNNSQAELWDRVAAYRIAQSYTPSSVIPSTVVKSSTTEEDHLTYNANTEERIKKLFQFANFSDEAEWQRAVEELNYSTLVANPNSVKDEEVLPFGEPIDLEAKKSHHNVGNVIRALNLKKVAPRMSNCSKKSRHKSASSEQTNTGTVVENSQGDYNQKASCDGDVNFPAHQDAYYSDDDDIRNLLKYEELSESEDDDHRVSQLHEKGSVNSFPLHRAHSTRTVGDASARYRHIVENKREPGTYHVFVPLPSYRFVIDTKRKRTEDIVNDDGDALHGSEAEEVKTKTQYKKVRNMEKLAMNFPSVEDGVLAYDACIRKLYGYHGFSYSTTQNNEWKYTSDIPSTKRKLRTFSHRQSLSQQMSLVPEIGVHSDNVIIKNEEVSDTDDADASSLSMKKVSKKRKKRVVLKPEPTPMESNEAYHAYIEKKLREISSTNDLTSVAAWRRRSSLFHDASEERDKRDAN